MNEQRGFCGPDAGLALMWGIGGAILAIFGLGILAYATPRSLGQPIDYIVMGAAIVLVIIGLIGIYITAVGLGNMPE